MLHLRIAMDLKLIQEYGSAWFKFQVSPALWRLSGICNLKRESVESGKMATRHSRTSFARGNYACFVHFGSQILIIIPINLNIFARDCRDVQTKKLWCCSQLWRRFLKIKYNRNGVPFCHGFSFCSNYRKVQHFKFNESEKFYTIVLHPTQN